MGRSGIRVDGHGQRAFACRLGHGGGGKTPLADCHRVSAHCGSLQSFPRSQGLASPRLLRFSAMGRHRGACRAETSRKRPA